MSRGKNAQVGDTYVAANGYEYTKMEDGSWEGTHRLVAAKKLGVDKLDKSVRVTFKDGDKTNLDQDNLIVREKVDTKSARIEWLKMKIAEYQAELAELQAKHSQKS